MPDKLTRKLLLFTDPKTGEQRVEIEDADLHMLAKAFRQAQPDRLLKLAEVEAVVGMKKSRLYALIEKGEFPKPIKEGTASLWPERQIQDWIAARIDGQS